MKRILSALLLIPCMLLAFIIVNLTHVIFGVGVLDIPVFPDCILLLAVFVMLVLLLSHLGLVLGGLLTGWKLAEFSIFGLGLHRDNENRLRLMYRQSARPLQALMTPPRLDGSSPFDGIYAGYVLPAAASGAILMLLAWLLRANHSMPTVYIMPTVFLLGGFLVMLALLCALRDMAAYSRLRKSVHLRRAHEFNALTSAAARRGLGVSSLPEEAFVPFPEEALLSPQVFVAQFNICTRLLNDGEYARAHELLQQLADVFLRDTLRLPDKVVWEQMLTLNGAIAEMMSGAVPLLSEKLDNEAMKVINAPGWYELLLLARYLRALLVTGDEPGAARQLAELNAQLEPLPEARTAGKRRILADAQAMALANKQTAGETADPT